MHSNIGGGVDDQELEDITLAWMMSQIHEACGVEFDETYVNLVFGPRNSPNVSSRDPENSEEPSRPWACGFIDQKHMPWYYRLAGIHYVRTPGQYFEVDPTTGWPKHPNKISSALVPLPSTNERVHASVRIRLLRGENLGINDRGVYKAEALTPHKVHIIALDGRKRHGWVIERVKSDEDVETVTKIQQSFPGEEPAKFLWRAKGPDAKGGRDERTRLVDGDGFPRVMVEDVLGIYEKMLMERDSGLVQLWEGVPARFAA